MTLLYISTWFFFSVCLRERVWVCIILPSHTHTLCAWHERGPIPGFE